GGVDAMPVRALAGRKQVVDRRAGRARSLGRGDAVRLRVVAALGVRLEAEFGDDVCGAAHALKLSLRWRSSAEVAGASPGWPIAACICGLPACRKGLAARSAPIVVGTVGSLRERLSFTSAA